jgi:hypothetical protein
MPELSAARPAPWPLLFPLTYALHVLEEHAFGFPAWSAQHLGFHLDDARFLHLNAIVFSIVLAVTALASAPGRAWLAAPIATACLVNGLAHAVAGSLTQTYSPGVVTGLALWAPLGGFALAHLARSVPRLRLAALCAVGIILHAIVTAAAMSA